MHHVIVYLCRDVLSEADVGLSQECDKLPASNRDCQLEIVLGGWAVGGEVS